ncbi:XRE family transcriptional regulator [Ectothiorhodospiraceae bacterium BW-2]|nr:XRE family transcriptional regulator [Ectothiorhodospiraceae bacterium BW-2]
MDYTEIGQTIAQLRKAKRISQQQLCRDIHIARATLSNFERGVSPDIGLRKVLQILDYLGHELVTRERSPFPVFEELLREKHSGS